MKIELRVRRFINSQLSTPNLFSRMCGIAGQFNFEGYKPVARETIVRMARSIAHRGPDDEGFFVAGPVGLGFRRLSIIDLAPSPCFPADSLRRPKFPGWSKNAVPFEYVA